MGDADAGVSVADTTGVEAIDALRSFAHDGAFRDAGLSNPQARQAGVVTPHAVAATHGYPGHVATVDRGDARRLDGGGPLGSRMD